MKKYKRDVRAEFFCGSMIVRLMTHSTVEFVQWLILQYECGVKIVSVEREWYPIAMLFNRRYGMGMEVAVNSERRQYQSRVVDLWFSNRKFEQQEVRLNTLDDVMTAAIQGCSVRVPTSMVKELQRKLEPHGIVVKESGHTKNWIKGVSFLEFSSKEPLTSSVDSATMANNERSK